MRPGVDMGDHVAMRAPHRARVGIAGEFRANTLAHLGVAGGGEGRLALMADQIANARPGGRDGTRTIDLLAGRVCRLGGAANTLTENRTLAVIMAQAKSRIIPPGQEVA